VTTGQIGKQARRLREADRVAGPTGGMTEGLGDVGIPHAHRPVQDNGFAVLDEAQGGEVPDEGGRSLLVVGEVELLDGGRRLEPCRTEPAFEGGGLSPVDLVLAQHLEELGVAELPGVGLGQAGLDGLEHP
jgi:hypothetical protein